MKTIKNTFVIIILLLLPFMVGCDNDTDLSDVYLNAVITGSDPGCGKCIVSFTDDKMLVERILGVSDNNSYLVVNLNAGENPTGVSVRIKARKATAQELPVCNTLYPASALPSIYVLDYQLYTFNYNRAFDIPEKFGMQSRDGQYLLRFDSVLTDSRCPEGLYCFWQGIAGVRFTITEKNTASVSFDLYTWNNPGMNWSDSTMYNNLKIRLLGLTPYPSANVRNNYNNYKARIIVTKLK